MEQHIFETTDFILRRTSESCNTSAENCRYHIIFKGQIEFSIEIELSWELAREYINFKNELKRTANNKSRHEVFGVSEDYINCAALGSEIIDAEQLLLAEEAYGELLNLLSFCTKTQQRRVALLRRYKSVAKVAKIESCTEGAVRHTLHQVKKIITKNIF